MVGNILCELMKGDRLMEETKRKFGEDKRDQEIVYSKAIKAGKRIYYLDVKKNRKDDLFLAITESKKKVVGDDVSFEKHKIFLYREDFVRFKEGIEQVIDFIDRNTGNEISGSMVIENQEDEELSGEFEVDFEWDRFQLFWSLFERRWRG